MTGEESDSFAWRVHASVSLSAAMRRAVMSKTITDYPIGMTIMNSIFLSVARLKRYEFGIQRRCAFGNMLAQAVGLVFVFPPV